VIGVVVAKFVEEESQLQPDPIIIYNKTLWQNHFNELQ
jgi:hypothetical protein